MVQPVLAGANVERSVKEAAAVDGPIHELLTRPPSLKGHLLSGDGHRAFIVGVQTEEARSGVVLGGIVGVSDASYIVDLCHIDGAGRVLGRKDVPNLGSDSQGGG